MQAQQGSGMEQNVVLIVGDRFADFANKPGVMTASELGVMLRQEDVLTVSNERIFVPGQGLSDEQMSHLYQEAAGRGLWSAFELWREALSNPRASGSLTHKYKPENALIGVPRRVDAEHFEVDLIIDDRNEIMSDHVTGQHLQGMLLIEACRQAFLAVTEQFFLPKHPDRSYYFVFNDLHASYYAFAFPLATRIDYRILEFHSPDVQRHTFAVEMDIVQNEEVVTRVTAKFTAFDSILLAPKEHRRAEQALRRAQATAAERCLKGVALESNPVLVERVHAATRRTI